MQIIKIECQLSKLYFCVYRKSVKTNLVSKELISVEKRAGVDETVGPCEHRALKKVTSTVGQHVAAVRQQRTVGDDGGVGDQRGVGDQSIAGEEGCGGYEGGS